MMYLLTSAARSWQQRAQYSTVCVLALNRLHQLTCCTMKKASERPIFLGVDGTHHQDVTRRVKS